MNRAAALAGCRKAVNPGHLFLGLSRSDGLDGLEMVEVRMAGGRHVADGARVCAAEGLVGKLLGLFDHLVQPVVSAGLENGGRDGDRPDPGSEQLIAVEEFRAAREGNAHLAVKLAANAVTHFNRQREQAPAGHVHFGSGQLVSRRVNREGVGELETELQTLGVGEGLQTLEHRDCVDPLEVLVEVMLVEDDVVIAHGVENRARGLVAEDGGVALDKRMQVLLGQKVRRDTLDFLRRTSVKGRDRDAAGDSGGDGSDIVLLRREELSEDLKALFELLRLGSVHHIINVGVDLFALDALEIVADGHIEHEAVGVAEAVDLGENLQCAPGLDVFISGLRNLELGRPFLVVALVGCQNAGARHTRGKFRAVHLLYGFHFKEARACHISGDDVLRQLAVGAGRGAERGFNALAEDGERFAGSIVGGVHTEDFALACIFGDDPVHERLERNRIHFFRHEIASFGQN